MPAECVEDAGSIEEWNCAACTECAACDAGGWPNPGNAST